MLLLAIKLDINVGAKTRDALCDCITWVISVV